LRKIPLLVPVRKDSGSSEKSSDRKLREWTENGREWFGIGE